MNRAVLSLLEEYLTESKTKRAELHHDLDDLCGSWTEDDAAAFDKALAKQRAIDPDLPRRTRKRSSSFWLHRVSR